MLKQYIKILIIGLFAILVVLQADKSFVLDEIDFPIVSHTTSQSFKPIYYRGEASPVHLGTYHPTLYINSLAMFIRVFGFSETSVRLYGVLCTLISAYLLVAILRQLTKKNPAAEALLLGLFLLNPYTIANTTLPDIDSTLLPVVILLFINIAIKLLHIERVMGNKTILILGTIFAVTLWSKLTTPLIIPPFLLLLAIISTKDYRLSLIFTLKVTMLGGIAFLATYYMYTNLLNLSDTYTYGFLLESFTKGTSSKGPLEGAVANLGNIRHFVFWPTIPVVYIFGISFLGVFLEKERNEKALIKKLLVLMALLVTFGYIALIAPFGGFFKYPYPLFGILILTIVFFYEQLTHGQKIKLPYVFSAGIFGFIVEKIFWEDKMFLNNVPFEGLLVLLMLIIIGYIILKMKNRVMATYLFVFFCVFSVGFQTSISKIQAMSTYPTKYHYGQTGLDQATSYLRANTDPQEVIWAMKDVGYYVNNKYYESYFYYINPSLEEDLINKIVSGDVRYYVVTTGIGQDNIDAYTNIKQILDTYAVQDKQFGNFIIYKTRE